MNRWCYTLAFGLLLLAHAESNDKEEVLKFMKKENMLDHCNSFGKDEDQCIIMLKQTCRLDAANSTVTKDLLTCIRSKVCGVPLYGNSTRKSSQIGELAELNQYNKKDLTYFVTFTRKQYSRMKRNDIMKNVKFALKVWECYSDLTFKKAKTIKEADIVVTFGRLRHKYFDQTSKTFGDDPYPFDGEKGILAHAYFPSSGEKRGNFHFDADEHFYLFNTTEYGGIMMFPVTVHEMGHALGIDHIYDQRSIMYPYNIYKGKEEKFDLKSLDIYEIRKRYGSNLCKVKSWKNYYHNKYNQIKPK